MVRKEALPELLSPAGSFECLVAAVAAGADAIYVGGRRFGARAFAKNFELDELSEAVKYCGLHGVRLYVTVNTLAEDRELLDVVAYARELYKIGVSALIVSDIGVISAIRDALPYMELHASTQMSVHSTLGADAAYSLGCKRVVLARELSLENIRSAVNNSKTEIEVFLHGALCVCHSGQCLFSSLVGGRSGNRGECAQPCRLPYSTPHGKEYPLSLKDLSLAGHIPELIDSGVASLKIEGRMKSAGYVYTVTRIYRRLLDEHRPARADELSLLRAAFSRGGFTDGYLTASLDSDMLGIRSESDKDESRKIDELQIPLMKKRVSAKVKISLGTPSQMTLTDGVRTVTVFGDVPAPAESHPLTAESVCDRLSKMGNTYLSLSPNDIELSLEEGINLSPASLNGLRRQAAEKFSDFSRTLPTENSTKAENGSPIKESLAANADLSAELSSSAEGGSQADISSPSEKHKKPSKSSSGILTTAEFYSADEFMKALKRSPELMEDLITFVPLGSCEDTVRASDGVILPAVILDSELDAVKAQLAEASSLGASCAMAQNIGQLSLLFDMGFTVYGGFRLNVCNGRAKAAYLALGAEALILSPELTLPKARDILGGAITYGRIPLMLTERCFVKESFGCAECGKAAFVDRRGEKFPVLRESAHRNIILNSQITYMGDKSAELSRAQINHRHLLFTNESSDGIISALLAIKRGAPLSFTDENGEPRLQGIRRMGRRDSAEKQAAPREISSRSDNRQTPKNNIFKGNRTAPEIGVKPEGGGSATKPEGSGRLGTSTKPEGGGFKKQDNSQRKTVLGSHASPFGSTPKKQTSFEGRKGGKPALPKNGKSAEKALSPSKVRRRDKARNQK